MCATFSLNLFLSGIVNNNWYSLDQPGLVNFGIFRVSNHCISVLQFQCVCVSVCLSLSLCVSMTLSLCLCICVCVCMYVGMCLMYMCVSA